MNMSASESKLPLYVLTGFLGSGKTSLLRECLCHPEFANTAVLVNEFGEIGLDHELVEASEEDAVVLKGGCICCTIREDLASSIRRLADLRREGRVTPFSRLVIETSGLADPVPVLNTLRTDPRITQMFEFRGAIVTVDAMVGAETLASHIESVRQIIYASRAVVTKCDLASSDEIGCVEAAIHQINQSISVKRSDIRGIEPGELFSNLHYDPLPDLQSANDWLDVTRNDDSQQQQISDSPAENPFGNSHIDRFCSFSWEFDHELDWTVFGIWLTMLLHAHGDRILRVKGILNVSGTDAPIAIHGVQHIVHSPVHMKKWREKKRCSRLVFVVQDLSPELVRRSFDAFNKLGSQVPRIEGSMEIPVGAGRTVDGRPIRRVNAPAWIKG